MTPLTVFFRTLMKSSAIFVGAGYIMLRSRAAPAQQIEDLRKYKETVGI